jgi:hypothetical protein
MRWPSEAVRPVNLPFTIHSRSNSGRLFVLTKERLAALNAGPFFMSDDNPIWIPGVAGPTAPPQPIIQFIEPSVNNDRYHQYLVSCELAKARVDLANQELVIHPLQVDKPISRRRVRHFPLGGFFFRFREFYRKKKAFVFR